jgi:NAD(P)-dependent dehydrogenase (short-subunit alcohol dehydrogenase family)
MKRTFSQFLRRLGILSIMPSRASRRGDKHAALVTGGAVRVGRAIAIALARAGMDVAIGYHRSSAEARRAVRALEAEGVRAVALRADLADAAAARRLVERAAAALGRLDVLVNNAAVFRRTPFLAVTPGTWDEFLDVNLRGPFFCAQAAARLMGRRGGHIVNVGDAAIARPLPALLPYASAKAGLAALTTGLAAALAPRGIAVNAVAPGPVFRPRGYPLARWRRVTRGRVVDVEDVASAVVFLATCSPGITGQTIALDGRAT